MEIETYLKLPYTFRIIPEEDGTFYISVEEFPGCASVGDTPEEALRNIKEAMAGWIESNLERGIKIPMPRSLEELSYKDLCKLAKRLELDPLALSADFRDQTHLEQFLEFAGIEAEDISIKETAMGKVDKALGFLLSLKRAWEKTVKPHLIKR